MTFRMTPTTLDQAIEAFFRFHAYAELADSTKQNKRQALAFLKEAAPQRGDTLVGMLTSDHFNRALEISGSDGTPEENERLQALGRAPRKARSVKIQNSDRTTLRQFAEFLVFKEWVEPYFNPLPQFTKSSRSAGKDIVETKIVTIPEKDYDTLLDAAEKRHPMNRMVIALGLWAGPRVSTAVRVQWGDINIADRELKIINVKRGRTKVIPMLDELVPELERYKEWLESVYGPVQREWYLLPAKYHTKEEWPETDYFYEDENGKRCVKRVPGSFIKARNRTEAHLWPLKPSVMSLTETINDVVSHALHDMGRFDVPKEGMHVLRHSLAEWCHRIDPSGRLAQVLLDHDTLTTTLKAYSIYNEQLQRAKGMLKARSKPGYSPVNTSAVQDERIPQQPTVGNKTRQQEPGQVEGAKVIDMASWRRKVS